MSTSPPSPGCEHFAEALSAAADGELTGFEADSLQAHLDVCDPCRVALKELGALRRHTLISAAPDLDGLIARLEPRRLAPNGPFRRTTQRVGLVAVAAFIVIVSLVISTAVVSRTAPAPSEQVAASGGATSVTLVKIMDQQSTTRQLVVGRGDTVRWLNTDLVDHHLVIESDGARIEGQLRPRGSETVTYTRAGTFTFTCAVHPSVHGTVTVV